MYASEPRRVEGARKLSADVSLGFSNPPAGLRDRTNWDRVCLSCSTEEVALLSMSSDRDLEYLPAYFSLVRRCCSFVT